MAGSLRQMIGAGSAVAKKIIDLYGRVIVFGCMSTDVWVHMW